MKYSFKISFLVLAVFIVFGCKSAKRIIESGEPSEKLSTKQIIKQHQKHEGDFKTLQARVKVEYTEVGKDNEHNHTISLRLEKDKKIWLSATLGVVRAMITPEKVQFYDKLNNQYFDGNYTLLSDILGIDLDFYQVQNLLLGQSMFQMKTNDYKSSVHEKSYMLHPKDQSALFELFLLLNPSHFKMNSTQIHQPNAKRFLQVDYKNYQDVDGKTVPENIEISAVENADEVNIKLEYKSVSLNSELRFPFNIPSGYKEIIIR